MIYLPSKNSPQNLAGLLLCTRFAFAPNRLKYCGPDRNKDLLEYFSKSGGDLGLVEILKKFETMYPYLKTIAHANNLVDPFNQKIVEAYWIGNDLLENAGGKSLIRHLLTDKKIDLKKSVKDLEIGMGKVIKGGLPHHSFHVFNVFKRKEREDYFKVIGTIDDCRISWGKITNIGKTDLMVVYEPISFDGLNIFFGKPISKKILIQIGDSKLINNLKIGDSISFHWGVICTKLTPSQVCNLKKYTKLSLDLANI